VRRSVDDRAIDVTRDGWQLAVKRVARDRYDGEAARERFLCAQLRPLDRAAGVGIGIDDGDALPLAGPDAAEMQRQCGLADSTLLVEERDDHGVRSWRRAEPRGGFPAREVFSATKNLDSDLESLRAPDSPCGE
jgi:hypothetical protein